MPYVDADTFARAHYLVDPSTGQPVGSTGAPLAVTSTPSASGTQSVVGNVAASTTDSGNPVKIGGVYRTTLVQVADGQRADAQMNNRGQLYAQMITGVGAGADARSNVATGFTLDLTTNVSASLAVRPEVFNGTSWDRSRKPNLFARVASSAASGNPAALKASAGDVMQFWGQNGAAITYLQLYNKATAPTIGTDTPVLTYPIPASAVFAQTIPNGGAYFGTGIAYAFTTDAAGTTGAAAAAVLAFALMAA